MIIRVLKAIIRRIKRISYSFQNIKIYNSLNQIKFVHIMTNDKFNAPFVDFFNSNFPMEDNIFICKRLLTYKFPEGKNVFEIKTYIGLNFKLNNINKIIVHGMFDGELISFLYKHKDLLKKTCWSIWGADLYDANRSKKDDFVRNNVAYYLPIINGDGKVAQQKYNSSIPCLRAPVCSNKRTSPEFIFLPATEKDSIKIQINNSADESTLYILDILEKFKNENIKITTILSYAKTQFNEAIIENGRQIFGEKFAPITEFMPIEKYQEYLNTIDILIMNQSRQQGLGNINGVLLRGKKVFIRSDISTWDFYQELGIKVFDTLKIPTMTFADFSSPLSLETKKCNRKYLAEYYSLENNIKCWQNVFDAPIAPPP